MLDLKSLEPKLLVWIWLDGSVIYFLKLSAQLSCPDLRSQVDA